MRKAFLILSTVLFSAASFAQQGLQLGIVGGPQSTWLINKNDSDDPAVRLANGFRGFVGATVDYHFLPQLGAGIELIYSLKGQTYSIPGGGGATVAIHFTNFELPLLLNFNSNPDKIAMFVGKFGPRFDFVTGTNYPTDFQGFKTVNVGMILGLGVGFNIAKIIVVSAGLRLDGGLTDPLNTVTGPSDGAPLTTTYNGDTHTNDPTRKTTWNVAGGIEIGVKYIIKMGKSGHHRR